MHLLLAGNDIVPISLCRGRGMHQYALYRVPFSSNQLCKTKTSHKRVVVTYQRTERVNVVSDVVVSGVPQLHGKSQRPLATLKRHVFARPNVHLAAEVEHKYLHNIPHRYTSNSAVSHRR